MVQPKTVFVVKLLSSFHRGYCPETRRKGTMKGSLFPGLLGRINLGLKVISILSVSGHSQLAKSQKKIGKHSCFEELTEKLNILHSCTDRKKTKQTRSSCFLSPKDAANYVYNFRFQFPSSLQPTSGGLIFCNLVQPLNRNSQLTSAVAVSEPLSSTYWFCSAANAAQSTSLSLPFGTHLVTIRVKTAKLRYVLGEEIKI